MRGFYRQTFVAAQAMRMRVNVNKKSGLAFSARKI
nr:MAG TPA: hypothetical protein [Caudoviricetes sp.]